MAILDKIKKANLVGRGGACFPTALKWESVAKALGKEKYVVCNAAEGEPGIKKDGYIIDNYPDRLIDGIEIALNFLRAKKAIIYINPSYYKKYKNKLETLIKNKKIEIFPKPHNAGYVGGEESSVLNAIEGKRIEPRLRPPFPTTNGLYGCPTLINNVETFYNVSLVNSGDYKKNRFYSINGDCLWTGVYEFKDDLTIEKVLKETDNYPKFPFFVQVGGDASGEVLSSDQLKRKVGGAGSITVYSITKHKPEDMIRKWIEFFKRESCGQCTPCREGSYRIVEAFNQKEVDWPLIGELLSNMHESSFCGLGCVAFVPINSYVNNVLKNKNNADLKMSRSGKMICECFNN